MLTKTSRQDRGIKVKVLKLKPAYLLTTLALCSAFGVAAQVAETAKTSDGKDDEGRAIEVIQISATKRVTTLRQTPLAVTAFDQKTLDDNHVASWMIYRA